MVQSRQLSPHRLMESMGLTDREGLQRVEAIGYIDPHDRHTWRSGVRFALEGGPLMWMLPLYLHVNKKSDDDDEFDVSKNCWMHILNRVFAVCFYSIHTCSSR